MHNCKLTHVKTYAHVVHLWHLHFTSPLLGLCRMPKPQVGETSFPLLAGATCRLSIRTLYHVLIIIIIIISDALYQTVALILRLKGYKAKIGVPIVLTLLVLTHTLTLFVRVSCSLCVPNNENTRYYWFVVSLLSVCLSVSLSICLSVSLSAANSLSFPKYE